MEREPYRTNDGERAPQSPTGLGPDCRRKVVKYWKTVVTTFLSNRAAVSPWNIAISCRLTMHLLIRAGLRENLRVVRSAPSSPRLV
eukprot:1200350-Pleurochrysis_carterae.AAC.2